MTTSPHARAFDLPGWPTPPRVRDIAKTPASWGWVPISTTKAGAVFQDELGYLWIDGNAAPRYQRFDESHHVPGAYAYWTEDGIGVYVHPRSYGYLGNISRLDMEPDRWLPVAHAACELPEFAKASA